MAGVVISRRFACAKEGQCVIDKEGNSIRRSQAETRTSCNTGIIIQLIKETEKYKVYDFVSEHNHPALSGD